MSLNGTLLSRYLDGLLPTGVQEEAFHRGAQLLRKESLYFDMFPLFFCLLWRGDFKHLELPPVADR